MSELRNVPIRRLEQMEKEAWEKWQLAEDLDEKEAKEKFSRKQKWIAREIFFRLTNMIRT